MSCLSLTHSASAPPVFPSLEKSIFQVKCSDCGLACSLSSDCPLPPSLHSFGKSTVQAISSTAWGTSSRALKENFEEKHREDLFCEPVWGSSCGWLSQSWNRRWLPTARPWIQQLVHLTWQVWCTGGYTYHDMGILFLFINEKRSGMNDEEVTPALTLKDSTITTP